MIAKCPLKDFDGRDTTTLGRVHYGFQHALDGIWLRESSEKALSPSQGVIGEFLREVDNPTTQLWLTGHSLGAALATIAAARVQLTDASPFKGRVGALVTVGSPRVLDKTGAVRLRKELGPERIFRIHRSIDPIPAIPPKLKGFKHVSGGRKAFISHQGHLAMDARWSRRMLERCQAALREAEEMVATALPGQHKGFGAFVSDHDSEDYLKAVDHYSPETTVQARHSLVRWRYRRQSLLASVEVYGRSLIRRA